MVEFVKNGMKKKIFMCGVIGIFFSLCFTVNAETSLSVYDQNRSASDSASYDRVRFREKISTGKRSEKIEGEGFDTPEEAALVYLKGLKEGDFEQVLSAFAVETYVKNYRLDEQIDGKWQYSLSDSLVPSVSEYTEKLNIEMRRGEIFQNIQEGYLSLIELTSGSVETLTENASSDELLDELFALNAVTCFNAIDYDGTFTDLDYLMEKYWNASNNWKEQVEDWTQKKLDWSGADRLECLAVNFTYAGIPLAVTMSVVQYDKKWYIFELGGVYSDLLGIPTTSGGLIPSADLDVTQVPSLVDLLDHSETESVLSEDDNKKVEGGGYSTATEAAAAYLEGFQKNNTDQMMAAFAVETYMDNFQLNRYVEYTGKYTVGFSYIPNDDKYMKQLNIGYRRFKIASQIRRQYFMITGVMSKFEENGDGYVINTLGEIAGDELLKSIFVEDDSVYLSDIEYERIFTVWEFPDRASDSDMEHVDRVREEMAYLGADQVESLFAKVIINHTYYKMGIDTVCYDGRWYVLQLGDLVCEQEEKQ